MSTRWPSEKVEACLKKIIHQELLPSKQEIDVFIDSKGLKDDEQLLEFLKFIYKKCKNLEIYGSPEEMLNNIKKVNQIPQFIQFSSCPEVEISGLCALLSPYTSYFEKDGEIVYGPKSTILRNLYSHFAIQLKNCVEDELVGRFYSVWQTANHNKMLRDLKGSYDVVRIDVVKDLQTEVEKIFKTKNTLTLPKKAITLEWFSNLTKYFEPEEKKLFDQLMDSLKDQKDLIKSKQDYYKMVYGNIDFYIRESKRFFEQHVKLFTPILKNKPSAWPKKPIVRRIQGDLYHYFFAKEVENAVKILMKNTNSKSKIPEVFNEILEKLGISQGDLIIVEEDVQLDSRAITLPTISSYGTHCMPSLEAFNSIVYYLAVVLKVFQRSNEKNLKKVFQWIGLVTDCFFKKREVMYLIEMWRIDEVIEKARKDLTRFAIEPEHQIALQEEYTKDDVLREIEELSKNLGIEKSAFITTADFIVEEMLKSPPVQKSHIYLGYCKIIEIPLRSQIQNVEEFLTKQYYFQTECARLKCVEVFGCEPEVAAQKLFESFRIVGQRQEIEQSPSSSSENAEIQKLRDNLEKIRKSEAKLQEKLKVHETTKKELESAENQILKLREELEKSKKAEMELQEKMEGQLKTVNSNFEEQLQKLQNDLDKSQISEGVLEEKLKKNSKDDQQLQKVQKELETSKKANSQLEEELKIQLKSVTSDFEEQIRKFQEELEKSQKENIELKENLKRKKCEVQQLQWDIQKKEQLSAGDCTKVAELENGTTKSENGEILSHTSKNPEFQQKIKEHTKNLIKEHSELVDIVWETLRRLGRRSPHSEDVRDVMIGVRKMEDCLDEYEENVKKEYKKLQE